MAVPQVPTGLPDLAEFCIPVPSAFELCLPLPGGITICAQDGFDFGDLGAITRSLFEQLNSALAPMSPIFNVIDVVKSIIDCVQAIPDCLGPPPNPAGLLQCIPGMVDKLQKVLDALPPVWIPKMVKAMIDVIIQALVALRLDLMALIAEQAAIIEAATKAAGPGGVTLQLAIDCAQGNLDATLANKNAGLAPLNRLLGVVNLFLELASLPCIPSLAALLTEAGEEALQIIDTLIEGLEIVKAAIPAVEFILEPVPGPEDPC